MIKRLRFRHWLWFIPATLAVLVLAWPLILWSGPGLITQPNYHRVTPGMSERQVAAILGKPWDDSLLDPEMSDQWSWFATWNFHGERGWHVSSSIWAGRKAAVIVVFENGVVINKEWIEDAAPDETNLVQRVCRRLWRRYGW